MHEESAPKISRDAAFQPPVDKGNLNTYFMTKKHITQKLEMKSNACIEN